MAADWRIFRRNDFPHDGLENLPEAPPWRAFGQGSKLVRPPDVDTDMREVKRGSTFQATEAQEDAVNAALYLRRPLLVTGKPGSGKSSLIYAVAAQLGLGRVLDWPITSRSTLKDGLYSYDALGRLYERQAGRGGGSGADDIGSFIELGPLGTALLPSDWPRALLIDEIDKGDLDLPNDLLHIFEEGRFTIPELARANQPPYLVKTWKSTRRVTLTSSEIKCRQFPFVVMTSNGEREFPAPFLRRCIRITILEPDVQQLGDIVTAHLGETLKTSAEGLIDGFLERRNKQELATDQLLNAVYLVADEKKGLPREARERLAELIFKQLTTPDAT